MNMRVNDDGKFWGRVVAAFAGAVPALLLAALVWWADSRAADGRAADALTQLAARIDKVESEAREARRLAGEDRQKTAELTADVRNVLRSTARIEALLDRMMAPPPSRP